MSKQKECDSCGERISTVGIFNKNKCLICEDKEFKDAVSRLQK